MPLQINQFHWHVVDSQSFPLEIPGFTDLADKGAYSSSQTYSLADVRDIVSYAGAVSYASITSVYSGLNNAQRGIDVMVEIDTPGHTAVIAQAHPDFVACAEATPWASFANGAQCLQAHVGLCISSRLLSFLIAEPPAGQLRFVNATVTNYIADLFVAAAKMFPSTLFSTGGDELNTNCYAADTPTQAALNASGSTLEEALNVFTQKTHQALEAKGKTPVVWEGACPSRGRD